MISAASLHRWFEMAGETNCLAKLAFPDCCVQQPHCVRVHRMDKFYWSPDRDEVVEILHQMYKVRCKMRQASCGFRTLLMQRMILPSEKPLIVAAWRPVQMCVLHVIMLILLTVTLRICRMMSSHARKLALSSTRSLASR